MRFLKVCRVLVLGIAGLGPFAQANASPLISKLAIADVARLGGTAVVNIHSRGKYHCHKRTERSCYTVRGRSNRRKRVCGPTTIEECHGGYRRSGHNAVRIIETSS